MVINLRISSEIQNIFKLKVDLKLNLNFFLHLHVLKRNIQCPNKDKLIFGNEIKII